MRTDRFQGFDVFDHQLMRTNRCQQLRIGQDIAEQGAITKKQVACVEQMMASVRKLG